VTSPVGRALNVHASLTTLGVFYDVPFRRPGMTHVHQ